MTYDPQKAIRQALMVARRHAAYGGGYEGYSSYGPMGYRKGLPAFVTQEELDQSSGDPGAPDPGAPTGAPGTGNFGSDLAGFAEAAGPAVAGAAVGAAMGGIPGAIAGMAVGNMAQGLAQNVGLSAPANAPVSGPLGVVGNIAQTAMSVAPDPADTEDADQGAAQNAAAAAAAAAAQAAADAEAADNANSNANAATADAAGPGEGNGDNGGDGNGGSGDGNGFAQGGDVGDAEDHSSHHEYEARCFANGGEIDPPENTVKAYKLFKTKKNSPGKLFPLFVNADKPVPVGKWIAAEEGPIEDGKVKSSLGKLAYRPGWHAGDLPVATHIGRKSQKGLTKPDYRPDNHVWAEVEMPADVDWQSVADQRADRDKSGKIIPKTAHITDQIPHGGFYRYKTNPNMTGNWLISGGMKVNRVLSDDEVKQINDQAGVADLPRLQDLKASDRYADGGQITPPRDLDADPVMQQALRLAAKKRPLVALADLFERQLRGRPPS